LEDKELYNENELLQKIAEGDELAFRKLFARYQSYINLLAIRMAGSEALAEDIVQDTFLKVWINRKTLTAKENFGGWLYHIAVNNTLNALKRIDHQEKYAKYLQREGTPLYSLPDIADEKKELETILMEAVEQLPPRQKQTYMLVKVKRMAHKEAANQLQVSTETIKSNLDHAIRFIRAYCLRSLKNRPDLLLLLLLKFL
jgi:RNA polymerase sigma-70 factor (ECF subfamily)